MAESMAPGSTDPGSGEHRQIADDITREHESLHRAVTALGETTDPRHLLAALEEIRPRLLEHFAAEEGEEGLHKVVADGAPHLLPSVQRVFEEHRELLTILDRLQADTRELVEGPQAEILEGVRSLCNRLEHHEAVETELLTASVYTDLGDSS